MKRYAFKIGFLCFAISLLFFYATIESMGQFGRKEGQYSAYYAVASLLLFSVSLVLTTTASYLARKRKEPIKGALALLVPQWILGLYVGAMLVLWWIR